eukprot:6471193-Amphidinium_carterae.2
MGGVFTLRAMLKKHDDAVLKLKSEYAPVPLSSLMLSLDDYLQRDEVNADAGCDAIHQTNEHLPKCHVEGQSQIMSKSGPNQVPTRFRPDFDPISKEGVSLIQVIFRSISGPQSATWRGSKINSAPNAQRDIVRDKSEIASDSVQAGFEDGIMFYSNWRMAAMAGLMDISFWQRTISSRIPLKGLVSLQMGKKASSASTASALFDEVNDEGKEEEAKEDAKRRRTDIVQCECCGAKPEEHRCWKLQLSQVATTVKTNTIRNQSYICSRRGEGFGQCSDSHKQDAPWATYTKKEKLPVGVKCKRCVEALSQAYPFQTWDSLMLSKASNEQTAEEISNVLQIYSGSKRGKFDGEAYNHHTAMGYIIEKPMRFFTATAFKERFGTDPREAGLELEKLHVGHNSQVEGVLLHDDEEEAAKGLKVKAVFSFNSALEKHIFQPNMMLRENQGTEFCSKYEEMMKAPVHRAFLQPGSCLSLRDIPKHIEEQERKKKEKEEEAQRARDAVAQAPKEDAAAEEAEEEADESSEDAIEDHTEAKQWNLPVEKKKKGKGKGKSKLDAAKKGGGASRGLRILKKSSGPGEKAAASAASSIGRNSTAAASARTKKSPGEKRRGKANEWMQELSPAKALECVGQMGRVIWGATATLTAMEKHDGVTSDSVMLKSKIDLTTLAEDSFGKQ